LTTALQPGVVSPSLPAQLDALLHAAAVAPLPDTGWLRVTGSDRVRWLNGMVTNSIQELALGHGCYNFVLNAQGRIQGDLTAFLQPDSILLETTDAGKLATHLDHYIIMDDVELEVLGNGRAEVEDSASRGYPFLEASIVRIGLLVAGPQAESILKKLDLPAAPHSPIHLESLLWHSAPIDLIHAHSPLVPRFELWSDPASIASLTEAITRLGATPASAEALEDLRILSGTPRYGSDIRDTEKARDLPQETNQSHALHFTKGCYLGQEIVERIHSRGQVHRTFTGFLLTGALPAPGTALLAQSGPAADPKPVGELTSVASIPLLNAPLIQLALGYIRREALEKNLILTYSGGTATPVHLPYSIA
jgi:aminomethyltransferase